MRIKEDFVLRSIGGNQIVMPVGAQTLDFQSIITLNETGAFLWNCLQEDCDEVKLQQVLLSEYDVSAEEAAVDVARFLESLRQADLLR